MASNKITKQEPLAGSTIKAVIAQRAYIAADALQLYRTGTYEPVKLNGVDPNGMAGTWYDLGIVAGSIVNVTYNKEVAFIETGLEKVRRGAYLKGKTASAEFTLEQFDSAIFANLGLSVDTITNGKAIHLGQEDIIRRSLLFMGVNQIDGLEYHMHSKDASVAFAIEQQDDSKVLKVTCEFFPFIPYGETAEALLSTYILSA